MYTKEEQGGVYYLNSGDLTSVVSAIGATETELIITGDVTISSNTTVPSTLKLKVQNGGSIDGGYTLTISGYLDAGRYPIFGSSITVAGSLKGVDIYPEWWGANTTPGTTDMTAEIQAALTLVDANAGGRVSFDGVEYLISSSLTHSANSLDIEGPGASLTASNLSGYMIVLGDDSSSYDRNKIEGIKFNVNGTTTGAISATGIENLVLTRNRFNTTGTAGIACLIRGCFFANIHTNKINGTFAQGILFQKAPSLGYSSNKATVHRNWIRCVNNSGSIGLHIQDGSQGITSQENYYEDIASQAIYCDTSGGSPNNLGGIKFSSIRDEFEDCGEMGEFDNAGATVLDPFYGPGNRSGFQFNGNNSFFRCTSLINSVFGGTHDGGTHSTILTLNHSGWNFTTDELVGLTLNNITDGSSGTITANSSTTITVGSLTGGSDNQWEDNDVWALDSKYEVIISSGAAYCRVEIPNPHLNISDNGTYTNSIDSRVNQSKKFVLSHTADFDIDIRNGVIHTNNGATSTVIGTLPNITTSSNEWLGYEVSFHRTDAHDFIIQTGTGDKIRFGDRIGTADEYLKIVSNGGSVTLRLAYLLNGAVWDVIATSGVIEFETFDGETQTGAGALSVAHRISHIDTTGGAAALTLADGSEGQEKFIVMTVDAGAGTLTPSNLGNGSTITFDDVGDSAHLIFTNGAWHFMGGTATLA